PWAPVERMVAELRARRDVVVAGLNAIDGMTCQEPAGAFYAFPRVADLGLPAADLADRLLADAGVSLLPGTAFGGHGEGYLRLSYATAAERLREGLERIGRVLATVPGA
ncbi:MAG TPA: aminotransferase class I/II-fold pyridoxal phosphate-dependent enzyme, partial [Actinomycetota bacterium]|nr:aminotransferase class I/II-fold pyridoxal phosphate-dependent enzyme [Actinomycetota bacterium]